MAKAHVPQFGNWEKAGNLPYTQCFDNARKGRNSGKVFNPNDPDENPEAFSEDASPVRTPPKDERRGDDGDPRRTVKYSPSRHNATIQKTSSDSPHRRHVNNSTDSNKRGSRLSAGSDRSFEQSPLHPHNQVKSSSKGGVTSPSWDKRISSEARGHSPNMPVKSKMRPIGRGDETPEKGSAVPKFGEWNESDPSAGEGYTGIFNIVSEERRMGPAKVTTISKETSYMDGGRKHDSSTDFADCPCFGWCRK